MSDKVRPELERNEARAAFLRLRGLPYSDIARDLKLDSCFLSKRAAAQEARVLCDSAAMKIDKVTP